jgi:trimeric autotransporter adhesin
MLQFLHRLVLPFILLLISELTAAQNVGIGITTPNASAKLDISSTDHGLLIPRMTSSKINLITSPAKGLLVYDSTLNQLMVNTGTPVSPDWQTVVASTGWNLTGNSGTNPSSQFIGTTDNNALNFRTNNLQTGVLDPVSQNIFFGQGAGQSITSGYGNIGIGTDALALCKSGFHLTAFGDSALYHNDVAGSNTALGYQSLFSNFNGSENTATGYSSLYSNTSGVQNTAYGSRALLENTIGSYNMAAGVYALANNTAGFYNTATGFGALYSNINTNYNTAMGYNALSSNTSSKNTATGANALTLNTEGEQNTAMGANALNNNLMSSDNTAVGYFALGSNIGGESNTAVGSLALSHTTNSYNNTVVGASAGFAWDMGYNNTLLGANCETTADGFFNCIAIGQAVTCDGSSEARIGNSATVSIGGFTDWSNISDGRYKKDLREDVIGLDFIMKLRPVTYYLDATGLSNKLNEGRGKELNAFAKQAISEKERMRLSGFVAQEVETAAKETGYDFSGVDKPNNANGLYALRYSNFVVPLVKAVQEMNTRILTLEKENAQLKSTGSSPNQDDLLALVSKQQTVIEDLQKRLQTLEEHNKVAVQ